MIENSNVDEVLTESGYKTAEEDNSGFDMGAAQDFTELENRKKSLEAEIRVVKKELNEIGGPEGTLLDQFIKNGVQKLSVGNRTIYIHRQIWASAVDKDYDTACDGLESAGLDDYVQRRFNTHSLSAYFREQYKDVLEEGNINCEPEDILPEELKGNIDLFEKVKLRSRKV